MRTTEGSSRVRAMKHAEKNMCNLGKQKRASGDNAFQERLLDAARFNGIEDASDIGMVNLSATTFSNRRIPARLYKGGHVLSEWVYWTKRIAKYQSVLKKTNGRYKSKGLSKLYAIRRIRTRHTLPASS